MPLLWPQALCQAQRRHLCPVRLLRQAFLLGPSLEQLVRLLYEITLSFFLAFGNHSSYYEGLWVLKSVKRVRAVQRTLSQRKGRFENEIPGWTTEFGTVRVCQVYY